MVHAARASVNRAAARFILRAGRAGSKGCAAARFILRAGRAGSKGWAAARFILRPARRRRDGSAASKGSATAPPSTRHFLIAGEKILKTELTPSVPSPNAFLIASICPTFFARAAPSTSNRYTYPIRNRSNPLTTNEKTFSNRYDSSHLHARAAPHPSLVTDHTSPPHLISIRYK